MTWDDPWPICVDCGCSTPALREDRCPLCLEPRTRTPEPGWQSKLDALDALPSASRAERLAQVDPQHGESAAARIALASGRLAEPVEDEPRRAPKPDTRPPGPRVRRSTTATVGTTAK